MRPQFDWKLFLIACLLTAASSVVGRSAYAQFDVVVGTPPGQAIRIAVVPFAWTGTGNPPIDIAALIETDLERSGYFLGIERGEMIANPTTSTQVNYLDWTAINARYLVIGQIGPVAPGRVQIQFQVFNVLVGGTVDSQQIASSAVEVDLRRTAHRISDAIFTALLDIPGVFETRMVYVRAEGAVANRSYSLWVSDSDGFNAQRVFGPVNYPILSPSLSPDGRSIAYGVWESQGQEWTVRRRVYVQTLATGVRREVAPPVGSTADVSAPAFSPDGRYLAVSISTSGGNSDIYVQELATGLLTRVTQSASINVEPTWSPDSQWVYFTSNRGGTTQVYRVRTGGTGVTELVTRVGNYNAEPRVSPDGRFLAVVHRAAQGGDRIALFNLQTTSGIAQPQFVSAGPYDESPSFAPSGTVLVYATRQGNTKALATVSLDGRFFLQRFTVPQGDMQEPFWGSFPAPVPAP